MFCCLWCFFFFSALLFVVPGVALAKRIGLIPQAAGPGNPSLYDPWQIRSVLPTDLLLTALGKGMFFVDEDLPDGLRLRRECRKVEWPTSSLAENGLRYSAVSCLGLRNGQFKL